MKNFTQAITRRPLWQFAAVGALITFGLALWIGSNQSVWFDEAFSIMLAHQPLGRLIHFAQLDTHPPLYYLTLKAWMSIFGDGDLVLRSLSALFGGLASLLAILLAGRMFGRRVAVLSIPFIVLAPFMLRYDFEIRMYAMAALWCVLGTYLMIVALQAKTPQLQKRCWALYALSVIGGAYTFYYCVFVWAAHFIWLSVRAIASRRYAELRVPADNNKTLAARFPWLLSYAAAVIIFTPWVPTVVSQVSDVHKSFWIGPVDYQKVVTIFTEMISYRPDWDISAHQVLYVFGGLFVAIWLIVAANRHAADKERWYFGLLSLYLLLPIFIMYLISMPPRHSVFLERYSTQALLAAYVMTGAAAGILWLKKGLYVHKLASLFVLGVLVAGVLHVFAVGNYNYQQLFKPNVKTVAAYVRPQLQTQDAVIVDGATPFFEYAHYLPENQLRFTYNGTVPTSGGYAMLHDSPALLTNPKMLTAPRVWSIHGINNTLAVKLPPQYHLIRQTTFNRTIVVLYNKFAARSR